MPPLDAGGWSRAIRFWKTLSGNKMLLMPFFGKHNLPQRGIKRTHVTFFKKFD
jgi:hypothetical protein